MLLPFDAPCILLFCLNVSYVLVCVFLCENHFTVSLLHTLYAISAHFASIVYAAKFYLHKHTHTLTHPHPGAHIFAKHILNHNTAS